MTFGRLIVQVGLQRISVIEEQEQEAIRSLGRAAVRVLGAARRTYLIQRHRGRDRSMAR